MLGQKNFGPKMFKIYLIRVQNWLNRVFSKNSSLMEGFPFEKNWVNYYFVKIPLSPPKSLNCLIRAQKWLFRILN